MASDGRENGDREEEEGGAIDAMLIADGPEVQMQRLLCRVGVDEEAVAASSLARTRHQMP